MDVSEDEGEAERKARKKDKKHKKEKKHKRREGTGEPDEAQLEEGEQQQAPNEAPGGGPPYQGGSYTQHDDRVQPQGQDRCAALCTGPGLPLAALPHQIWCWQSSVYLAAPTCDPMSLKWWQEGVLLLCL